MRHNFTIICMIIGIFVVPLNSSMVALALEPIANEFQVPLSQGAWVVTIYLIGMAVFQIFAGRFVDRFGSMPILFSGTVMFALGTIICWLAPTFMGLLIGRLIQASGGAALVPASSVRLREMTPIERQGRMFGLLGAAAGIGAALGPPLGGLFIQYYHWRFQFIVTLILMLFPITLIANKNLICRARKTQKKIRQTNDFVLLRLVRELFKIRSFRAAAASVFLNNFMVYLLLMCVPLLVKEKWYFNYAGSGTVMLVFSVAMIAATAAGGAMSDRFGKRPAVLAGCILASIAGGLLLIASSSQLLALFIVGVGLAGLSLGSGNAAIQATALEAGEAQGAGIAAGIYYVIRYLGSIVSTLWLSIASIDGSAVNFSLLLAGFMVSAIAAIPCAIGIPMKTSVASEKN
ncbi:MFS transporter [Paenibacillaceae sp. P-4]|uniref:MFS transporter n=1 Tax=Paenibacillaceae bacterium P-4 TaxID=3160969 RepID=UPI0032E83EDB